MRLKELRTRRKLRQQDVADAVNCSQAVYSRYENGEREPSKDTLNRLADFYGVSVDYILGRDPVADVPPTREPQSAQDAQYEIRILHRGNHAMTKEQLDRREALMRLLWEMDDDELDRATQVIDLMSPRKKQNATDDN